MCVCVCACVSTQVWSIRCDLHIVDHGGNLVDVASIAAVGALLHFRRPDVSVAGEKVTIHPIADRVPVPLSVHHVPICVSFAIFTDVSTWLPVKQRSLPLTLQTKRLLVYPIQDAIVADPTDREELVAAGRLTFSLNNHGELCLVHKLGGAAVSVDKLLDCAQVAATKVRQHARMTGKMLYSLCTPPHRPSPLQRC